MDFTINNFNGSAPRLEPHLLKPGAAELALDCNLHSGALDSWREPKKIFDTKDDTKTVVYFNCCWLEFDKCVDVAYGAVNCTRLYTTGNKPYPTVITLDDDCKTTERRLGIPCPKEAPQVDVNEEKGVDKDLDGRSYAYQYVNSFDERGALSPASKAENIKDGSTVAITGWEIPDSSWDVKRVRIYRSVSGMKDGDLDANELDTQWMFVGEVDIEEGIFVDSKFNEDLISSCEEDIVLPPPSNLQGMIHIESINSLAGFVGRRIYFSNNNEYHNWAHFMDLDDEIQGIVESGGVIYVATSGRPYAIEGDSSCESAGCREAVRLPGNYPMVNCGNRYIAKVRAGAVYPSHQGLILLSGRNSPAPMTWPYYAPEDWQDMIPQSALPIECGGKIFVFMERGAFIIKSPSDVEQGWDNDAHTELSDRGVHQVFENPQGEFYLMKDDGVYLWNRGEKLRPHRWVSSVSVAENAIPLTVGYLIADYNKEYVKITVDRREILSREVTSGRTFRLPKWAEGARWQIELSGTASVKLISIASGTHELGS